MFYVLCYYKREDMLNQTFFPLILRMNVLNSKDFICLKNGDAVLNLGVLAGLKIVAAGRIGLKTHGTVWKSVKSGNYSGG